MNAQTSCCDGAFTTPDPHILRATFNGQEMEGLPDSHAHQTQAIITVFTLQAVANSLKSH